MAKIVIAGRSDCPYFARVELLGDRLQKNLPSFHLHKIVKKPQDWETWLQDICGKNSWTHGKSPIVWRELIDRGGKGVLIGDANDFQEYVNIYYNYMSQHNSDDVRQISRENQQTKIELEEENYYFKSLSKPMHICISNASGGVCYSLINNLAKGDVFGNKQELSLHLLYNNKEFNGDGLTMEVLDMNRSLVRDVIATSDVYEAFCDCKVLIILDDIKQDENEDKPQYYAKNAELFKRYALVANQVADKSCKVVVAGNGPTNFNTSMFAKHSIYIQKENIIGVSRFVENSCRGIIGSLLKVNSVNVDNVVVWGNINSLEGRYVDLSKIGVHQYDYAIWGPQFYSVPLTQIVYDTKWLESFPDILAKRQPKIEESMGHDMFVAHASAISSLIKDWWNGCEDKISSMVVPSRGTYGVPEGLYFSLPVRLHSEGYWSVVEDIDIDTTTQEKIKLCLEDLQDELEMYREPDKYREKQALQDQKPGVTFVSVENEHLNPERGDSAESLTRGPSLERIDEEPASDDNPDASKETMNAVSHDPRVSKDGGEAPLNAEKLPSTE